MQKVNDVLLGMTQAGLSRYLTTKYGKFKVLLPYYCYQTHHLLDTKFCNSLCLNIDEDVTNKT